MYLRAATLSTYKPCPLGRVSQPLVNLGFGRDNNPRMHLVNLRTANPLNTYTALQHSYWYQVAAFYSPQVKAMIDDYLTILAKPKNNPSKTDASTVFAFKTWQKHYNQKTLSRLLTSTESKGPLALLRLEHGLQAAAMFFVSNFSVVGNNSDLLNVLREFQKQIHEEAAALERQLEERDEVLQLDKVSTPGLKELLLLVPGHIHRPKTLSLFNSEPEPKILLADAFKALCQSNADNLSSLIQDLFNLETLLKTTLHPSRYLGQDRKDTQALHDAYQTFLHEIAIPVLKAL